MRLKIFNWIICVLDQQVTMKCSTTVMKANGRSDFLLLRGYVHDA
jgi:hypothetical protein